MSDRVRIMHVSRHKTRGKRDDKASASGSPKGHCCNTYLEWLRQTMFEPLSALAVLGFTTGTLGFIVSTISKLDEKTQEIRECESRLQSFSWQLDAACMQLKVWHSIWIGSEAFPRETYVHFWGTEGLEDIESRVTGIIGLLDQIWDLLCYPHNNAPNIRSPRSIIGDWHQLIYQTAEQILSRRDIDHRKASLVRKIGFTLFHNAEFLEKISRLENYIEGLVRLSQWHFRLEQHGDPNEQVTSAELNRISDMKSFVDRISKFANLIYMYKVQSEPHRSEWAIELAPPEPGCTLDFWSEVDIDTMNIDFLVTDEAPDLQPNAIRLRLYAKDHGAHRDLSKPITERIGEILLDHQKLERECECDRFFSLRERPCRRSRPLRRMLAEKAFSGSHRKAFEAERADLVYGLGHWMVLLSNTPWSFGLCACNIHCICLADAGIRHAFFPLIEAPRTPRCDHRNWLEDKLKLLGVMLAEVALAFPIQVQTREEFLVDEEIASRQRLLGMLRDKFGRNTITKAVGYCLDPSFVHIRGSLRPDYFDQYCQNIVLP